MCKTRIMTSSWGNIVLLMTSTVPNATPFTRRMARLSILAVSSRTRYSTVRVHEVVAPIRPAYLRIDTFGLTLNSTSGGSPYTLTDKGIAWPKEKDKYRAQPGNPINELTPPPNWALRYPNGYTNDTQPPNLAADEHFQVWMRPSGTSTFTKLWSRNNGDTLRAGTYDLIVSLSKCPRRVIY